MIAVDGGEVWADDSGGDGPPLVLLHPGVGDSRIWEPVLPALTASYRAIRYDARGYGRSPAPAVEFSLLADLIAVLGYYGLDRAAFAGCSQGGGSALGLVLEQPARVSALVLLCPGIPGFPEPEEPGGDPENRTNWKPSTSARSPPGTWTPWPASFSSSGPAAALTRRSWSSCARRPGPRSQPAT